MTDSTRDSAAARSCEPRREHGPEQGGERGPERVAPARWFAGAIAGSIAGAGCVLATSLLDNPHDVLAYTGAWLPAVGLLTGLITDHLMTRTSRRR